MKAWAIEAVHEKPQTYKGRWPLYLLPLYLNMALRYPNKNTIYVPCKTETLLEETTNPYNSNPTPINFRCLNH